MEAPKDTKDNDCVALPSYGELIKAEWDRFYESVPRPCECLFCSCIRIWWDGSRARTASVRGEGKTHWLAEVLCRRVKCSSCRKSWTLRPPGLMPQRHFQLCVAAEGATTYLFAPEPSIAQVAREVGASHWTVSRWIGWLGEVATPSELYRHVLNAAGAALAVSLLSATELPRRARNASVALLRSAAAQVLCLFEALGAALALEPPGLRCVVEAVLANRYRVTTYARPNIPEFANRVLPAFARPYAHHEYAGQTPKRRRGRYPGGAFPLHGPRSPP